MPSELLFIPAMLLFYRGPALCGFLYYRRIRNFSEAKAFWRALEILVLFFILLTLVADLGAALSGWHWLVGVWALVITPYLAAPILFWKTRKRPTPSSEPSPSSQLRP